MASRCSGWATSFDCHAVNPSDWLKDDAASWQHAAATRLKAPAASGRSQKDSAGGRGSFGRRGCDGATGRGPPEAGRALPQEDRRPACLDRGCAALLYCSRTEQ